MIKNVIQYPGGKVRAIKYLLPHIPSFKTYIEPFVGGGSLFFALKQDISNVPKNYILNDLNYDLYCFWKTLKENGVKMIEDIRRIKETCQDGKALFENYKNNNFNEYDKAIRYFVLNRISFSGLVDAGGYSNHNFYKRFTYSSIDKLEKAIPLLQNVLIFYKSYEEFLSYKGEDVFLFIDPPYCANSASKLYGNKGTLHTIFNHTLLAENLKNCKHKWLLTYDDCELIRELYSSFNIVPYELQYGMNNFKQNSCKKGKELLIKNY